MDRTLQQLFQLGQKYGRDWATNEVAPETLDLFCEKIDQGDIAWVERQCKDAYATVFDEFASVSGPWKDLFYFWLRRGSSGSSLSRSAALRISVTSIARKVGAIRGFSF